MPSWGFNADAQSWTGFDTWIDTDGVGGLGCLFADVVTNPPFTSPALSVPVVLNDPFSAWVKVVAYSGNTEGGTVNVSIKAIGDLVASSTPVVLTIPAQNPQTYNSGWFKVSGVFPGTDTITELQVIVQTLDEANTFDAYVDAVYLAQTDPLGSLNYTLKHSAGGVPGGVLI